MPDVKWPDAVDAAIAQELSSTPARALARAAEDLSARYRGSRPDASMRLRGDEHRAYLAARAPATYAAARAVFDALVRHAPALDARTLLDLGAGPGVASWAALDALPALSAITLVERDASMASLGRRIVQTASLDASTIWQWMLADLGPRGNAGARAGADADAARGPALPAADVVLAAYSLGELDDETARHTVARAWQAASAACVIIEPGTPRGFETVLAARQQLIDAGASIAAPCPHARTCPMAAQDPPDWCHFAVRLPRTRLHRLLKGGSLSYEDEKFAYVIASRPGLARPAAERIVRHPLVKKGHVDLTLCASGGLTRSTVARSAGDAYKQARNARWGDETSPCDRGIVG